MKVKRAIALNKEDTFRSWIATRRVPVGSPGLHQVGTWPQPELWLSFRTLNVGAGQDYELHGVSVSMERR